MGSLLSTPRLFFAILVPILLSSFRFNDQPLMVPPLTYREAIAMSH